jgi:hypothetical protein
MLEPSEARLFECRSRRRGAIASPARPVLTAGQAQAVSCSRVLDGWQPTA